MQSVQL
jgi:hypothetical protein